MIILFIELSCASIHFSYSYRYDELDTGYTLQYVMKFTISLFIWFLLPASHNHPAIHQYVWNLVISSRINGINSSRYNVNQLVGRVQWCISRCPYKCGIHSLYTIACTAAVECLCTTLYTVHVYIYTYIQ